MKLTTAKLADLIAAVPADCRDVVKVVTVACQQDTAITHPKHFSYKLACASGVLVYGGSPDFLQCVAMAKESKRKWLRALPFSTLRVQLFYPNKKRVPVQDIKAALRSLAKLPVAAPVAVPSTSSPAKAPARSEARTAAFKGSGSGFLAVDFDGAFSQAGVVAPPDGLTGGTFAIFGSTV